MSETIVKGIVALLLALWEYFTAKTDAQRKAAREKADLAYKQALDFIDNDLLDHNADVDAAANEKYPPPPGPEG